MKSKFFIPLFAVLLQPLWVIGSQAMAENVIIKALVQKSPPKYLLGEGAEKGVCGDIYAELNKRLSQKGVYVEAYQKYLPIKRILKMVETGPTSIYCGAGRNAEREKIFIYSEIPVYEVSDLVITHLDNFENPRSFKDFQKEGIVVGSLYGTSSARFLALREGISLDDKIYTLDKGFNLVALKRIDYFYYHDLGLLYLLKMSNEPLRLVPTRFDVRSQWMIYSKKIPENIRESIDKALTDMMNEGVLKRIRDKYQIGSNYNWHTAPDL